MFFWTIEIPSLSGKHYKISKTFVSSGKAEDPKYKASLYSE